MDLKEDLKRVLGGQGIEPVLQVSVPMGSLDRINVKQVLLKTKYPGL